MIIFIIDKNQLNMRCSSKMIKNCCINTTIKNLARLKKLFIISLPILIFSCSSAKKEDETILKKRILRLMLIKEQERRLIKILFFQAVETKVVTLNFQLQMFYGEQVLILWTIFH